MAGDLSIESRRDPAVAPRSYSASADPSPRPVVSILCWRRPGIAQMWRPKIAHSTTSWLRVVGCGRRDLGGRVAAQARWRLHDMVLLLRPLTSVLSEEALSDARAVYRPARLGTPETEEGMTLPPS